VAFSGDGVTTYNNPNDPGFNGGTLSQDGVGGVYVRFQICNGTNDFVLNFRSTSPSRYLNLDFSQRLAPPNTAGGAVDLTGKQIHQLGEQINEMANTALYSSGCILGNPEVTRRNQIVRVVSLPGSSEVKFWPWRGAFRGPSRSRLKVCGGSLIALTVDH
jgi:hypothetical protein